MTRTGLISAFVFSLILGAGLVPAMAQAAAPPAAPGACGPACDCGPRQEKPRGWMMGRMAQQLKLSDEQKASFKAIMEKHKGSMEAGRKATSAARKAFFEALRKPDTAPETLKTLHRTLSDLQFERMQEHRAMRQELRAVLNPDQREQAARMEGRMEGMRMARGGQWGRDGEFRGGLAQ